MSLTMIEMLSIVHTARRKASDTDAWVGEIFQATEDTAERLAMLAAVVHANPAVFVSSDHFGTLLPEFLNTHRLEVARFGTSFKIEKGASDEAVIRTVLTNFKEF